MVFEDAIVFPGLINSHDHLDFNLFPQLGNRIYENYVEWGNDIHLHDKEEIEKVLRIPKALRVQWGLYKNLLNGITTVVNHGEWVDVENNAVNIIQDCQVLHSVQLEKNWIYKLNSKGFKKKPVVIHIGEGTDEASGREIDRLIDWNIFKRTLIGVHGVAMNGEQASFFKALVWCPGSNYFLLGRTAPVDKLKNKADIVFGTDSTVSAHWNIWEQLRQARALKLVGDAELFSMLTSVPAQLWRLNTGKIMPALDADMVIARKKTAEAGLEQFYSLNPEDILMVINQGNITMVDEEVYEQARAHIPLEGFSAIPVKKNTKYVRGDIEKLVSDTRKHYPELVFPYG